MSGSRPLLVAVSVVWIVVWLTTQTAPTTPLPTAPTVAIGVAATLGVVWGYPSVLRGPRRGQRRRFGLSIASHDDINDPLTAVSRTLPHLREGLTEEAAVRSAEVLLPLTGGNAVEITDRDRVLGRSVAVSASAPHTSDHGAGAGLSTASSMAIAGGDLAETRSGATLVVATPLRMRDEVMGTMVVTYDVGDEVLTERLLALAALVSLYLETSEMNEHAQRLADAELDALRAQINPHFLFNTLNTIASKNRTNPDEARHLLQRLADFFRYATQQKGQFAEFAHEYFFVRTYLSLEQARFGDRLTVLYDIDTQVLPAQVPVLVIQPLVENAVKHGIAPKPNGGTVILKARVDPLAGAIRISVRDDGIGIDPDILRHGVPQPGPTERRAGVRAS